MAAEATQAAPAPGAATATVAAATEAPTAQGVPTAASSQPKGKSSGKSKSSKRAGSKPAKGASPAPDSPSVATHPRATRAVARAKSWGGLGGFLIAGYLSLPTGTLADAALRALVAGCVCYVVAWAGAVFVWRRLVVLEIKGREQQLLADLQPAREQVPASRAQPDAGMSA